MDKRSGRKHSKKSTKSTEKRPNEETNNRSRSSSGSKAKKSKKKRSKDTNSGDDDSEEDTATSRSSSRLNRAAERASVSSGEDAKPCIAVHCVAGLGRAPVLVAIAMLEQGVVFAKVVKEIRNKRPGALNMPQLKFLQKYKPRKSKGGPCIIQ